MPSKERVSIAQLKVGNPGDCGLVLHHPFDFLLTGNMSWFQKEIPLHVFTSDAAGLTPGASVRINGISAGKVTKVELSGETNPQRIIRDDFDVDQDMQKQIPADSIASISSDNLLAAPNSWASTRAPLRP